MSVLCAFEAAARHQSFTGAALELSLTQSAVSRQIRALEELLGTDLFVRERQTVRLNKAGEAYAREIREALKRVSAATLGFRANPQGGTLNIAILPTFGTRWLAPRLPAFMAANPGITINRPRARSNSISPPSRWTRRSTSACRYGRGRAGFPDERAGGAGMQPELRGQFDFQAPADLLKALLHRKAGPMPGSVGSTPWACRPRA